MKIIRLILSVKCLGAVGLLVAGEKPHYVSFAEEKKPETQVREQEQQRREDDVERIQREQEIQRQRTEREAILQRQLSEAGTSRNLVRDVVADFLAAYKHYEQNDPKAGDALLIKMDERSRFKNIPEDQLKKLVVALEPKPEMRLTLLDDLTNVLAMRRAIVGEQQTLLRLISSLMESLQPEDFQKILGDEAYEVLFKRIADQIEPLIKEPKKLLSPSAAEELFYTMITVVKNLVVALQQAPENQKKIIVDTLLEWVRSIPVTQSSSLKFLHAALEGLPLKYIPDDYESARDWVIILSGSETGSDLQGLKMSVLQKAREKNTLPVLREALRVTSPLPFDSKDPLFPLTMDVRNAYLTSIATTSGLRSLVSADADLIIDAVQGLTQVQPGIVSKPLEFLLRNLPNVISIVEAEAKGKDLDSTRKKILADRVATLKTVNEQLPSLIIPEHKLPEAVWKGVASRVNERGKPFEPAFLKSSPQQLNEYLFALTEGKPVDVGTSLKRFVAVYNFYAELPYVQKILLNKALERYAKPLSQDVKRRLLETVVLDPALQKFLYADAGALGFFGYSSPRAFKNELFRVALDKALAKDRRALLGIVPTLFELRDVIAPLLSNEEGRLVLYNVMADISDKQFADLMGDIGRGRFIVDALPILFNATLYINPQRTKMLIDIMSAYKKTFEAEQQAKPSNQRIAFPITDAMTKDAISMYETTLKNQ